VEPFRHVRRSLVLRVRLAAMWSQFWSQLCPFGVVLVDPAHDIHPVRDHDDLRRTCVRGLGKCVVFARRHDPSGVRLLREILTAPEMSLPTHPMAAIEHRCGQSTFRPLRDLVARFVAGTL
jgi:hypothetical protein